MRIWIYGTPFSGKTTFASNFKDAKILSTDGNAEYLFDKEDIIRIKSAKDLKDAIENIKQNPPETLIIDTTEYLLDYLRFEFLAKNNIDHEGDIAYRGYAMLRQFQWEQLVKLSNMADNVIFISHESMYVEKNKFGREITYYIPDFDEKLRDKMMGLMTVVMRTVKSSNDKGESSYKLHIAHADEEFGGTRLPIKEREIDNDYAAFTGNFIKKNNK